MLNTAVGLNNWLKNIFCRYFASIAGCTYLYPNRGIMKKLLFNFALIAGVMLASCASGTKAKKGCTIPDRNMGAERIMSGEGPKKPSKFKIKGMN